MTSRPQSLELPHGVLEYPAYLPDATFGVVRSVSAGDLEGVGVKALVMNTFHLMQRPGSTTVSALGGLHQMSGWDGIITTDSGGFQAYSLIRENPKFGKLTSKGLTFKPENADRNYQLTPEKTVQLQLSYGSDIVITLDDCAHAEEDYDAQETAVERTIDWARRGKAAFDRISEGKKLEGKARPKIFAVIQGGNEKDLRKRCADALLEMGFDGFGFGGWPLDGDGALLVDILGYLREIIPPAFPLHALGIGHPVNVVACWQMGYDIFDCAMPTRDARHGRLYTFSTDPKTLKPDTTGEWLKYRYINDKQHRKDGRGISPYCDCPCCSRYSIGYLRHLFKMNETLFLRLATLHNLRFITQLIEVLRREGNR